MIRAVTLFAVLSLTTLALWTFTSSASTSPQIGTFSNRVILIRHGEKGPQSLVPHSLEDSTLSQGQIDDHRDNTGERDGHSGHKYRGFDHRDGSVGHESDRKHDGQANNRSRDDNESDHHRRKHHVQRPGNNASQLSEKSWWRWPPHGPPSGPPGGGKGGRKFPSGLNDDGRLRAQYLRTVFGEQGEFDIGMIFAAPRDLPIETERTYATVAPLALDLGLNVTIDCAESGAPCVVKQVEAFAKTSKKDILIAWKHRDLNVIATALGANNAKNHYPDERYDIIWIFQNGAITEKRSMHCPGLDDGRVDEGDPDLEIEEPSSTSSFGSMWSTLKTIWSSILPTF